jgi:hypothetical protein
LAVKTKVILGSVLVWTLPIDVLPDEFSSSQKPTSAVALRTPSHSPTAPLITLKIPRTDIASNVAPTPGMYSAAPYTMLVYVPPPIDPKILMQPGENSTPGRIIKPELRLIPRQR